MILSVVSLVLLGLLGQDTKAEETSFLLAKLEKQREQGEYRQAEKLYRELLEETPKQFEFCLGLGRVLFETGRYDEALGVFAQVDSNLQSPALQYWKARTHQARGQYEEAQLLYQKSATGELEIPAKESRASLLWEQGKREEANALWKEITVIASKRLIETPAELVALGHSYERFQQWEAASEVYLEASEKDPGNAQAAQALGDLYFRVYGDTQGQGPSPRHEYEAALKKNPNSVENLLSLFELYRPNFLRDQSKTEEFLRRALAVNPNSVRGLLLQADLLLKDRRFEDAAAPIEKALGVNAKSLRALSYRAVWFYLRNQPARFAEIEKSILEADSKYGDLYEILGTTLKDLYRFADAVPWLEKAIKQDPELNSARTELGQALVHSGREVEGRKVLEEAEKFEEGFVQAWRHNMLIVLKNLQGVYVKHEDPPFIFYFHPQDAEVLKVYLPPLYQEAWKSLSKKYEFTPTPPIQIETFQEAQDFSTRTIGYTGFGALGACFGPVITAVSPSAEGFGGHFNYLGTAWHEFTHVITIGLSNARIPRWLTEGLSTYEEKLRDPSQDRGMELELLDAYANGQIYPIQELNSAFRGPRIIFGYYQGGLICEFLAREYSFSRLVKMVKLYGEDRPTEEIFQQCFDLSTQEFDQRFLKFVEEKLRDVRLQPNYSEEKLAEFRNRVRKNPKDLEAWRNLAWTSFREGNRVDTDSRLKKIFEINAQDAQTLLLNGEVSLARGRKDLAIEQFAKGFSLGGEEFFARMHYAALLEEEKEYEKAIEQYRLAKKAFPRAKNPQYSPHLALRRLLSEPTRQEQGIAELEEFAQLDSALWEQRLELAAWYAEKTDWAKAIRFYEEVNAVSPFQRSLHVDWAKALRESKRFEESVREWQVARMISKPKDEAERAELFFEEALTCKIAGKLEKARVAVLEALRLVEDHEGAKKLLQEIESLNK